MDEVKLALELNKVVHNECKDVPYDIGLKLLDIIKKHVGEQLNLPPVINWVALSDKMPTKEVNGEKLLIYRIVNKNQRNMAMSIHDTYLMKNCNANETWWMELPKPPCL